MAESEQNPATALEHVEKAAARLERLSKIGVGIGAALVATAGVLVSVSSWWDAAVKAGVVLIIPAKLAWLVVLLGSNAAIGLTVWLGAWSWRRKYSAMLHAAWTAELSLLPEFVPGGEIKENGEVRFTLRIINRSPRRWFLREIDWTATPLEVAGQRVATAPKMHGIMSNEIKPWSKWQQEFRVAIETAAHPLPAVAAEFSVPSGAVLWVVPDDSVATVRVFMEPTRIWFPVRS